MNCVTYPTDSPTKQCPFCAEMILKEATVCKHCGKELCARQGWGRITVGILLILCATLISVILASMLGPLAFLIYPIIILVGCILIGTGIKGLLTPVKRK
jgi:uncharacterized membrane protein